VNKMTELYLLTARSWRTTIRDPVATFGRLVQCLFFAVLLALFFANLGKDDNGVRDRAGALFMAVVNTVFMHVLSSIAIFPPERAVFLQEQTNSMYSAGLYYVSKWIAEFPIVFVLPLLYSIITYFSWDLARSPAAFFNFWVTLEILAHIGNAFGLLLASLFPRPEIAMTLAPLTLMPQLLVGGLFANTDRLEPAWYWLEYISFPRYGYKALFTSEFEHIGGLCASDSNCRFSNGQDVLNFYGFALETDKIWFDVIPMILLMLLYRAVGAFGLHIQGAMRRNELVFEGNFRKGGRPAKGHVAVNITVTPPDEAASDSSASSALLVQQSGSSGTSTSPQERESFDVVEEEEDTAEAARHEPFTPAPTKSVHFAVGAPETPATPSVELAAMREPLAE